MTTANTSSWIYQSSPSREDIQTNSKYRKTRRQYGALLAQGRMIQLQDLKLIPAPVVCPACQKPVITTLKSKRTGTHLFHILFVTVVTVGLFTYVVTRSSRTMVHICPNCGCYLAELPPDIGYGPLPPNILSHYASKAGELDKPTAAHHSTTNIHGNVAYQVRNEVNTNYSIGGIKVGNMAETISAGTVNNTMS